MVEVCIQHGDIVSGNNVHVRIGYLITQTIQVLNFDQANKILLCRDSFFNSNIKYFAEKISCINGR